jgi:hypothetical protein
MASLSAGLASMASSVACLFSGPFLNLFTFCGTGV